MTLEPATSNVVVQDISTSMAGLAPITPVLVPGRCKVSRRSYTMNALPPASYDRVGRPQSRTSSDSGAPLQELRTSLYGVVVAQDARTTTLAATKQRFNADTSCFRVTHFAKGLVHHCCSQGTPSLFPSIFVPGQLLTKNLASLHEVICEQCVRPSHRDWPGRAVGAESASCWRRARFLKCVYPYAPSAATSASVRIEANKERRGPDTCGPSVEVR